MKILVTGGAGFIGSVLCRKILAETPHDIVNVDKLTYAADLMTLRQLEKRDRYKFYQADISNLLVMSEIFISEQPDAVMHLAAESHVDRSISGPGDFIQTNLLGTYILLEAARDYYEMLPAERKETFRFHHVSTDEVYGSLGAEGSFSESAPYAPNSPYSASKAGSDHMVRAWHETYGLPVLVTNCSNNYGPHQYPEKFIPVVIRQAILGKAIPVYGTGENVRDWLYVEDHAEALILVLTQGKVGQTYNIGGETERRNIDLAKEICHVLDSITYKGRKIQKHAEAITFVKDRPGHDYRYAMNINKISNELGWRPRTGFQAGIRKTVEWYLENRDFLIRENG